ncbi:DUF6879 family protein [Actinocrispum wychmicini]|uniref:DUF6879 domain-containing protein n=1 Tax=Actinocrispum wychmicini TaxID=1213861 RepID=A0A4R2JF72_9PSEU|nr:DUF6879 family protein [Actinocrispum wychmicini]TCO56872.1 hypothetical protein EV192_106347 [Actinocrispum wychmicini]
MTVISGAEMAALFDGYQRTAWRFEAQPVYTMPDERASFTRFLAGEPKPSGHNEDWHLTVRSYVTLGKKIGRVRIVRQPLTDYQRYQLAWGIPGNIDAGEDIRILDVTGGDLGLPTQDFWMFDESIVVHLNFNTDGTFRERDRVDSSNLSTYLAWRDVAMKNSVSFAEYARP